MTTLTLSQSLFENDLSNLFTPSIVSDKVKSVFSDLQGEVTFNEEQPENGTLKNPTFSGLAGEYQTNGSVTFKTNAAGDVSGTSNFKGATIKTDSGVISLVGAFSTNASADGNYISSQKLTGMSYIGEDGNKWSVIGGYSLSYKYTASSDKSSQSYSGNFQSLSATDVNKNSINFTGNLKLSYLNTDTDPVVSGYITAISLTVAGQKLNATGLKLTYEDILSFELGSISDLLPQFLAGNDVLTVSTTDPIHEINGYSGNDKIVGSSVSDTLVGGAGSDKLTGGKGADTFAFSRSDFFTENADGESVFNKSTDTITDFNLSQYDMLDFSEMGQLTFYNTLNEAKSQEAELFYVKGKIYYNIDTTGEKYTPTVIITLTGNPAVNMDGTDFNYIYLPD